MDTLTQQTTGQGRQGYVAAFDPTSKDYVPDARPVDDVLTTNSLISQSALQLPETTTPTAANALIGATQGIVDGTDASTKQFDLTTQANREYQQQQSRITDMEIEQRGILNKLLGTYSERQRLEKEAGLADITLEVKKARENKTAVRNALISSKRAQEEEARAILQRGDITKAAQEQQISNINQKYATRQADLSLDLLAATADLENADFDLKSATEIIDGKINAIKEPLELAYKYTSDFLERNYTALDKKEQRAFEAKKSELERQQKLVDDFSEIQKTLMQSAASQNAPASVMANIGKAKTAQEAYQAAGQYAGDILERQKKFFETEKARIEYQQALEPGIGPDAPLYNGLDSKTATAVRGVVSGFKSEPQLTNFATIQDGYNFTQAISDTTTNPADDQALIYSLAKTLDPSSVVREGEYATAQKYAQSWVKAYGKGVTQAIAGTGFLSKEARQNIKNVIETKYISSKRGYDNLYGQYIKQINNLTGRNDGSAFLRDYSVQTQPTKDEGGDVDLSDLDFTF